MTRVCNIEAILCRLERHKISWHHDLVLVVVQYQEAQFQEDMVSCEPGPALDDGAIAKPANDLLDTAGAFIHPRAFSVILVR